MMRERNSKETTGRIGAKKKCPDGAEHRRLRTVGVRRSTGQRRTEDLRNLRAFPKKE